MGAGEHQEQDQRFSFGLVIEVAEVLARHGFPRPTGRELVELRQSLYRFLYLPALWRTEVDR
jgi:hypothetical protein